MRHKSYATNSMTKHFSSRRIIHKEWCWGGFFMGRVMSALQALFGEGGVADVG